MKILREFFGNLLWPLVFLTFFLLISAWSALIIVSHHVPSQRLTVEEESLLLKTKQQR